MILRATTALLLTTSATSSAYAATATPVAPVASPILSPIISKDWRVDSCVASTTATLNGVNFRLEVASDSAHLSPLEVRIIPSAEMNPAALGMTFALDKKTTYAFARLAASGVNNFWNIPRGTIALITYLKREVSVPVMVLNGGPKPLKLTFSLKGSTAALAALQKQCNAAQEFGSDGFERAFLPANVANVDPSRMDATTTAQLRDLVQKALTAFNSSNTTQAQANALTAQYLAQITEYEQLRSNLDTLTHNTVVALTKKQNDAQAAIDKANVEIPQLKARVASQEAALSSAQATLDQATRDLAPLLPTLQRYQEAVDQADQVVSNARADLNAAVNFENQTRAHLQDMINGVNNATNDIAAIQNQIASLRNAVQNANAQVDQARRFYNDAQTNRQRFNKFGEIQRRMQTDGRLSSLESQLRDARNRLPGAQQLLSNAEADRAKFTGDLHNCQATPAPAGAPPKDCRREQELADRSEQRMQQAQNEFNGLQNQIRDLQNQCENFRQTIAREVDADYDRLVQCENNAQAKVNDAQSNANQIMSQLNQAQNSDLPQAQNNLMTWRNAQVQAEAGVRSAQNGTAAAQNAVANAQADEAAAENRRDQWANSSGEARKAAAVDAAQSNVDSIKSSLASLDQGIANREKLIRVQTQVLADTEAQMQTALATIKQKEARSTEVQALLAPYFQQRDALAAQKAVTDQAFKDAQASFAAAVQTAVAPVAVPVASAL